MRKIISVKWIIKCVDAICSIVRAKVADVICDKN